MEAPWFFVMGLATGLLAGGAFAWWRVRDVRAAGREAMAEKEAQTQQLLSQMKESFSALSLEALSKNTEEFLKMARENLSHQTQAGAKELEGKKHLIDQTLKTMKAELEKVGTTVHGLEKDRRQKFGELAAQLKHTAEQTESLKKTTSQLHSALASGQSRGQWGERMAEDVLRLAGFVEGINYRKQATSGDGENLIRPDYTFYLPQGRMVHMDVKFPLDNYMKFLSASAEVEKEKYRSQFIKDVRARVDEVVRRGYADPAADTLDYVLVFIPNEQVYAFLNECDQSLLDTAMSKKVILCSPLTLYAVLAVIRQAVDNFHLERTASEILQLLGTFNKQWDKFVEAMNKLGQRIDSSQKAFAELTTTRRNMLEKPLRQIDELRDAGRLEVSTSSLRLVKGEGEGPAKVTPKNK